jgi:hypothetical protein
MVSNGSYRTGVAMSTRGWLSRAAVTAAAVTAAILAGSAAHAAPAGQDGPALLAVAPPVVRAQTPTWLTGHWLARSAVCEFRLTVSGGEDVQVAYPSNTGTYSSFYRADYLGTLRSDYTAFRVTAAAGGEVPLHLRMAYIDPDATYRPGGKCAGRRVTRTLTVRLAVLTPPGP